MAHVEPAAPASGIYAALLTPRKAASNDGDAAAMLDYLDRVVNAGAQGIVLFGSTGEFIHYHPEERMRVASLVIRRSRVPALVNISHSTLAATISMAENALKIGATGVLLMPPYFYRFAETEILAFYREVCAVLEGQLPLYLYNLPAYTNSLSATLIERLLDIPSITGIKDSSGDRELLSHLFALRKTRSFQLLAGQERLLVEVRQGGGDGAVSGISAAFPELIVALDRSVKAGNAAKAAILSDRLKEYIDRLEELPPVVAIRETAAFRGWISSEASLPLSPEATAKVAELRSWLGIWLPETLALCQTRD